MQGGGDNPGGEGLSGYSVEGLLGDGPSGEVWLAIEESSGDRVAIKRLRLDPVDGPDALRRVVTTLDGLAHPHLLRIRRIAGSDEHPALVVDHAESGSLGQLLEARRRVAPAEAVTVLGPIAEALAAVHGRGLVHGSVTPHNVLFTHDGRPMLSDTAIHAFSALGAGFGTGGFTDPHLEPGGEPTAAGDVFGLAAVGWTALTGSAPVTSGRPALLSLDPGVPPGLAHAIEAGLQEDPALRPGADQLADMVYAATSPAPVRFPVGLVLHGARASSGSPEMTPGTPSAVPTGQRQGSAEAGPETRPTSELEGAGDRGEPRGRSFWSPMVIGLAGGGALIAVAAVVVLGLWWSRHGGGPSVPPVSRPAATVPAAARPTPEASTASTGSPTQPAQPAGDWTTIVRGLVGLRALAFERADPAIVAMAFVGDSPAGRIDAGLVDELRKRAEHAEHYRLLVRSTSVASRSPNQVRLHAVTQQRAYTMVSRDGERVRTAAKPPIDADIVLRRAADGYWRIYNW
jgi:serine/threonine protein kinase